MSLYGFLVQIAPESRRLVEVVGVSEIAWHACLLADKAYRVARWSHFSRPAPAPRRPYDWVEDNDAVFDFAPITDADLDLLHGLMGVATLPLEEERRRA
jgi:hypothetical protein